MRDSARRRTGRWPDPAQLRSTASGVSSRADDFVGAMAGAIAGARFGASAIPQRWLDALEDGERGRSHVERLAAQLAKRAVALQRRGRPGVAVTAGPQPRRAAARTLR